MSRLSPRSAIHSRVKRRKRPPSPVSLRFFKLESGSTSIRFLAEPAEAFELHGKMHKVHQSGGKESLSHRFEGRDGEVQTRLTVERWERGGKS